MGLIRKTLMVTSLGMVKGSSKKQRVAKATLEAAQKEAWAAAAAVEVAQQQADREHQFRYDTDPAYQTWWDQKEADRIELLRKTNPELLAQVERIEAAQLARRADVTGAPLD